MVSDPQVSGSRQTECLEGRPSPTPSSGSLLCAPMAPHQASWLCTCLSSLPTFMKALDVSTHLHMIAGNVFSPHSRGGQPIYREERNKLRLKLSGLTV